MPVIVRILRVVVTLAVVACACVFVIALWRVYMLAAWTRDARVFAQTVVVAPEVAGTVLAVPLADNGMVRKGQLLFQIDQSRFRIALDHAEAQLHVAELQLKKAREDAARRRGLTGLISAEDISNTDIASDVAGANARDAQAEVALAKLNLARATIRSPVDGVVSHLRLQAGDFAQSGAAAVSLINTRSYRVTGYFEETKLSRIHVGEAASIRLMGYPQRLTGHVVSIGRGISDQNDSANTRGLPEVNPVFEWVRLAQRIPVEVAIDRVPAGVTLAAGMTCSVDIGDASHRPRGIAATVQRWLEDVL